MFTSFEKFKDSLNESFYSEISKDYNNKHITESVFVNPSIKEQKPWNKGIIVENGDLFVTDATSFLHMDLVHFLVNRGEILYRGGTSNSDDYARNYTKYKIIPIQKLNKSNHYYLGETIRIGSNLEFIQELIDKCLVKNPFIKISPDNIDEHYNDQDASNYYILK